MLTKADSFVRIVEVNPPELPDMSHLLLEGAWSNVLVTDNVFGQIRVSPFAFAARITHDVPTATPTVVVSTRDRNILAIESEVRGALGNGVRSFLVVVGDTMPQVDHLADHYEIARHLRDLQADLPVFEVGMPTRFRAWQKKRRIEAGAQFLVCGPIMDPDVVREHVARLELTPDDPPVFVMVIPPFSIDWVDRMESMGAVPVSHGLRERLAATEGDAQRAVAWQSARSVADAAAEAGCAGAILMGLRFSTIVDEAALEWRVRSAR
ncbi:MAG TPA: methylenetetrahydrofolate reductase [Acidimicrobiia bacterium]|nr:methylenetetrahydrofolate reductase [Acidimicrobiia bacterium]